jgi:hypothetical protein
LNERPRRRTTGNRTTPATAYRRAVRSNAVKVVLAPTRIITSQPAQITTAAIAQKAPVTNCRARAGSLIRFVWDDRRYFLAVARSGTLSAGAEKLGTEHTTAASHTAAPLAVRASISRRNLAADSQQMAK